MFYVLLPISLRRRLKSQVVHGQDFQKLVILLLHHGLLRVKLECVCVRMCVCVCGSEEHDHSREHATSIMT